MRYTIFNSNGSPKGLMELTIPYDEIKETLALNIHSDETAVEGDYQEGYYLDKQKALTAIPLKPSPYHEWDWDALAYTGPHLDKARAEVWERVKSERARRWAGGFACAGHWWHSDENSRLQYLTNKDMARDQLDEGDMRESPLRNLATGAQIVWKAMDGEVPLTVGLVLDVAKAAKVHEAQVYAAAEAHRAAVYASDDPNSYDLLSGWPDVFEGGDV